MIKQAVILAAGRGTRLGALTERRPKSMLPILGKPIVARVMDQMVDAGIRRFVVVVGPNDGGMRDYLGSVWHPGVAVGFALQAQATGTVDALQLAAPQLDGPFVLASVDNLTSAEHIANLCSQFARFPDQAAVLSLLPASPAVIRTSSGVVLEDSRVVAVEEKPAEPRGSFASIMIYAFNQDFLGYLPQVAVSVRGEREIVSAIQVSIAQGRRVGYVIVDKRLHLTRDTDLLDINRHYLRQGHDTDILSEIPVSTQVIPPVRIDPQVYVGPSARVGPNVYLETGATVEAGAVVQDSVVLAGGVVTAGQQCQGQVVAPNQAC